MYTVTTAVMYLPSYYNTTYLYYDKENNNFNNNTIESSPTYGINMALSKALLDKIQLPNENDNVKML